LGVSDLDITLQDTVPTKVDSLSPADPFAAITGGAHLDCVLVCLAVTIVVPTVTNLHV